MPLFNRRRAEPDPDSDPTAADPAPATEPDPPGPGFVAGRRGGYSTAEPPDNPPDNATSNTGETPSGDDEYDFDADAGGRRRKMLKPLIAVVGVITLAIAGTVGYSVLAGGESEAPPDDSILIELPTLAFPTPETEPAIVPAESAIAATEPADGDATTVMNEPTPMAAMPSPEPTVAMLLPDPTPLSPIVWPTPETRLTPEPSQPTPDPAMGAMAPTPEPAMPTPEPATAMIPEGLTLDQVPAARRLREDYPEIYRRIAGYHWVADGISPEELPALNSLLDAYDAMETFLEQALRQALASRLPNDPLATYGEPARRLLERDEALYRRLLELPWLSRPGGPEPHSAPDQAVRSLLRLYEHAPEAAAAAVRWDALSRDENGPDANAALALEILARTAWEAPGPAAEIADLPYLKDPYRDHDAAATAVLASLALHGKPRPAGEYDARRAAAAALAYAAVNGRAQRPGPAEAALEYRQLLALLLNPDYTEIRSQAGNLEQRGRIYVVIARERTLNREATPNAGGVTPADYLAAAAAAERETGRPFPHDAIAIVIGLPEYFGAGSYADGAPEDLLRHARDAYRNTSPAGAASPRSCDARLKAALTARLPAGDHPDLAEAVNGLVAAVQNDHPDTCAASRWHPVAGAPPALQGGLIRQHEVPDSLLDPAGVNLLGSAVRDAAGNIAVSWRNEARPADGSRHWVYDAEAYQWRHDGPGTIR